MPGNNEDYLKAILELGGDKENVSNIRISKYLKISPPSVSEMLKRLDKKEYVKYSSYKGVTLTEKGLERAYKVRRKHYLWEVFLIEKLGYSWDEVHEEAEILEHITNEKLEKRLDKFLGYPKNCPHGRKILRGSERDNGYRKLSQIEEGQKSIIKRAEDRKDILNFMDKMNLKINDKFTVKKSEREDFIIKLNKNDREVKIKEKFIENIHVK